MPSFIPGDIANFMTRARLRRAMRNQRRNLHPSERIRYALRLTKRMESFRAFRNSQRIAFYLPHDGEMDLTHLMRRASHANKRCYLPIICPLGSRHLWFAAYHLGDRLHPNRLHILEPVLPHAHWIRARALDLVLIPLVAFDAAGNRLGMGGGYYDRTLAFLTQRRYWRKPRIVGVAYDFQRITALTPQSWDIAMDAVLTEACTYRAYK